MMKKLSALLLVVAISIGCFGTASFADEVNPEEVLAVQDIQRLPHKEFSPQKLEDSMTRAAGPSDGRFVANCEAFRATSDSYWDGNHQKRWPIDEISVYFRSYKHGGLVFEKTDTQYNASHAAAGRDKGIADENIGQHYFEESGYESWQTETYY